MNRLERLLIILIVLLVLGIGAMVALFLMQPETPVTVSQAPPAPAPTLSFRGETALRAYVLVRDQVQVWQPDAQLAHVTATWPEGSRRDALLQGPAWEFAFYSPAAATAARFTVVGEEVDLRVEQTVGQPLSLPAISGWQVDSDAAVRQMLEAGGDDFLQRAGATTMTASLRPDEENARFVWFISLYGPYSNRVFNTTIDAAAGDIIAMESLPE